MRDEKEFQKLLDKLHLANKRYKQVLDEARIAYENRYGHSSSKNDTWVDAINSENIKLSVEQLDESVYNMPDEMPRND